MLQCIGATVRWFAKKPERSVFRVILIRQGLPAQGQRLGGRCKKKSLMML
jgi:hypothetical protein